MSLSMRKNRLIIFYLEAMRFQILTVYHQPTVDLLKLNDKGGGGVIQLLTITDKGGGGTDP